MLTSNITLRFPVSVIIIMADMQLGAQWKENKCLQ